MFTVCQLGQRNLETLNDSNQFCKQSQAQKLITLDQHPEGVVPWTYGSIRLCANWSSCSIQVTASSLQPRRMNLCVISRTSCLSCTAIPSATTVAPAAKRRHGGGDKHHLRANGVRQEEASSNPVPPAWREGGIGRCHRPAL